MKVSRCPKDDTCTIPDCPVCRYRSEGRKPKAAKPKPPKPKREPAPGWAERREAYAKTRTDQTDEAPKGEPGQLDRHSIRAKDHREARGGNTDGTG